MSEKMTLDEYLGRRGLSFPVSDFMLDKLKIPHGLTQRAYKKLQFDARNAGCEYSRRRNEATKEYNSLVKSGEIIPKTVMEQRIERAVYGHPDNSSTQAARRLCEKRGIDWRKHASELKGEKHEI